MIFLKWHMVCVRIYHFLFIFVKWQMNRIVISFKLPCQTFISASVTLLHYIIIYVHEQHFCKLLFHWILPLAKLHLTTICIKVLWKVVVIRNISIFWSNVIYNFGIDWNVVKWLHIKWCYVLPWVNL